MKHAIYKSDKQKWNIGKIRFLNVLVIIFIYRQMLIDTLTKEKIFVVDIEL
jgi:hypothetical protein